MYNDALAGPRFLRLFLRVGSPYVLARLFAAGPGGDSLLYVSAVHHSDYVRRWIPARLVRVPPARWFSVEVEDGGDWFPAAS